MNPSPWSRNHIHSWAKCYRATSLSFFSCASNPPTLKLTIHFSFSYIMSYVSVTGLPTHVTSINLPSIHSDTLGFCHLQERCLQVILLSLGDIFRGTAVLLLPSQRPSQPPWGSLFLSPALVPLFLHVHTFCCTLVLVELSSRSFLRKGTEKVNLRSLHV